MLIVLRIKLLETVDGKAAAEAHNIATLRAAIHSAAAQERSGGAGSNVDDNSYDSDEVPVQSKYSQEQANSPAEIASGDLGSLFVALGKSWANLRLGKNEF